MSTRQKRVAVLMSGGVDSSVAACLLKEVGYEVIGFTLQLWPASKEKEVGGCCGLSAINDAKAVAKILRIPHYVLNFRKVFEKEVIDYFCQTYLSGQTPNPCVMCNRRIKFFHFSQKAREISADYIATGHYARIVKSNPPVSPFCKGGRRGIRKGVGYLLKKGTDLRRDQSYFLYNLTREQMAYTLFPLGELTKEEVRKKARSYDFPNAEKEGSQEICFIPDNDYGKFIRIRIPRAGKPGSIFNQEGKLLGKHKGIAFYTVGQREGLGISFPEPLYVIRIDPDQNCLIVGEKKEVYRKELFAIDVNWITEKPSQRITVKARIRYRNPETRATLTPSPLPLPLRERVWVRGINSCEFKVKFDKPQFAVTPGQSVVFYQGETVLGGGLIQL
ncbi:MAG: tRNA 2-thiouridine(34) synthase MnmA [bacterium (Candidatus Ratteibacteria) CG23_combo_of_CG06-09_8_20_14_all_48_7]|uniref:tRNA-specific 2-thiouridylase MnmA n=1 Tax=bacterium (Candidatus Ratteibacteria) CG23_combo_of_CG06-09_8_20_14_all_48_7 TaxID=2014292 RepID=A0A2G9YC21_9BACT|nr:MAG: tRNA 2-thiouridine(34) synthase MnmA [bacterium (Candidatus Ratteibacteria) CG23_combo_of_CG06-09_8_20_14_all_48_7]